MPQSRSSCRVSYLNLSEFVIWSCRTVGAQTKQLHMFGKGMLDTLDDDAIFNQEAGADHSAGEPDNWCAMGKKSRHNHGWAPAFQRQGTARAALESVDRQDAFTARRAAATRAKAAAAEIPEYDAHQCTTLPPASLHSTRSNRHTGCPGQARFRSKRRGTKFRSVFLKCRPSSDKFRQI